MPQLADLVVAAALPEHRGADVAQQPVLLGTPGTARWQFEAAEHVAAVLQDQEPGPGGMAWGPLTAERDHLAVAAEQGDRPPDHHVDLAHELVDRAVTQGAAQSGGDPRLRVVGGGTEHGGDRASERRPLYCCRQRHRATSS